MSNTAIEKRSNENNNIVNIPERTDQQTYYTPLGRPVQQGGAVERSRIEQVGKVAHDVGEVDKPTLVSPLLIGLSLSHRDRRIHVKGVVRPERARALVRQAENAGFTYCWFYDSHILWRESFVAIAMLMEHTTKMRFGPCVTNPNTRDWSLAASLFGSLALQSRGRFDLGVGRGDSAVRVMGKKPATLARLEEFVHVVKALVRGEEARYDGCPEPVSPDHS